MYKLFSFFLLTLIIASCTSDSNVPENVLPKDKMVVLVKDLHLLEAYVNANFSFSDSSKFIYKKMEDSILTANGTNQVTFDSSMAYYQRNLKDIDEIYAAVVDSLSLLEGKLK